MSAKTKTKKQAEPKATTAEPTVVAAIFKLLGDATRLRIVQLLNDHGDTYVGDICRKVDVSQPAVSHSLMSMRLCGIVEARRDAKRTYYALTPRGRSLAAAAAAFAAA